MKKRRVLKKFLWMALAIFLIHPGLMAATKIDPALVKPGAEIVVDIPELGNSGRRKTEPVQAMITFPDNYDEKVKHPILASVWGGYGGINQAKRFNRIIEKKNFICIGVDYSIDKAKGARDPGFQNVMYVLKLLGKVAKFDSKSMVIAGFSSGAYNISDSYDSKNGKAFSGYILIAGGMGLNPSSVKKKAVLLIAGEKDTQKASQGKSRVSAQVSCYEKLKKAKANVALIMQKGVGHSWSQDYDEEVRDWFYEKLPLFSKHHAAYEKMKKTKSQSSKKRYAKSYLKSPFEMPHSAECREFLVEEEKQ